MTYFSLGFSTTAALSAPFLLQYNRELMKSILVGTEFVFTWWGILAGKSVGNFFRSGTCCCVVYLDEDHSLLRFSGAMVGLAIRLSFFSVSLMGIALNAAVSMGAAAVTSFVWGVAVNNDRVQLLWIDVMAVCLVIGGGAIAALFKETRQTAGEIQRFLTQGALKQNCSFRFCFRISLQFVSASDSHHALLCLRFAHQKKGLCVAGYRDLSPLDPVLFLERRLWRKLLKLQHLHQTHAACPEAKTARRGCR